MKLTASAQLRLSLMRSAVRRTKWDVSTGIRSKLHLVKNSYVKFCKVVDIRNFYKSDKNESGSSRHIRADIKNVHCDTTSAISPREEVSRMYAPESSQPTTKFEQELKDRVKERQMSRMKEKLINPSEETVMLLAGKIEQLPAWDKALATQQPGNPDQQTEVAARIRRAR